LLFASPQHAGIDVDLVHKLVPPAVLARLARTGSLLVVDNRRYMLAHQQLATHFVVKSNPFELLLSGLALICDQVGQAELSDVLLDMLVERNDNVRFSRLVNFVYVQIKQRLANTKCWPKPYPNVVLSDQLIHQIGGLFRPEVMKRVVSNLFVARSRLERHLAPHSGAHKDTLLAHAWESALTATTNAADVDDNLCRNNSAEVLLARGELLDAHEAFCQLYSRAQTSEAKQRVASQARRLVKRATSDSSLDDKQKRQICGYWQYSENTVFHKSPEQYLIPIVPSESIAWLQELKQQDLLE
jgi:hypothetical protein